MVKIKTVKEAVYCSVCDITLPTRRLYEEHITGKRHKKIEKAAKEEYDTSCTLFITNLKGIRNRAEFLRHHFSIFGNVEWVHIKSFPGKEFALLKFDNQLSAQVATKKVNYRFGGCHVCVRQYENRNVKRKAKVEKEQARDKEKDEYRKNMMYVLSQSQSFKDQFIAMVDLLKLTEEDLECRRRICDGLSSEFYPFFQTCSVHQIGSSINGYGMKGCDLDLFLDLHRHPHNMPQSQYPKKRFEFPFRPTEWPFDSNPTAPLTEEQLNAMTDISKIKLVRQLLRKRGSHFQDLAVVPAKRCPLVKMTIMPDEIKCDLSLNNRKAQYNSQLLKLYSQDPRVIQLVIFIRYWAKVQRMGGSEVTFENISSYALTWLVLFYLMNRKPRAIPLVKELTTMMKHQGVHEEMVESCKCIAVPSNAKLPPSQNQESTTDLLVGFYQFYTKEVDWDTHALVTLSGEQVTKESLEADPFYNDCPIGGMTMLDPFDLNHNILGNINETTRVKFKAAVQKAAEVTKDWTDSAPPLSHGQPEYDAQPSTSSNTESSSSPTWGLAELLIPLAIEKAEKVVVKHKISGELDNNIFSVNLIPDDKFLSSEEFRQLSEKEDMDPVTLWSHLAHKMVVEVLADIFMMDVVEECGGGENSEVRDESFVKHGSMEKEEKEEDSSKNETEGCVDNVGMEIDAEQSNLKVKINELSLDLDQQGEVEKAKSNDFGIGESNPLTDKVDSGMDGVNLKGENGGRNDASKRSAQKCEEFVIKKFKGEMTESEIDSLSEKEGGKNCHEGFEKQDGDMIVEDTTNEAVSKLGLKSCGKEKRTGGEGEHMDTQVNLEESKDASVSVTNDSDGDKNISEAAESSSTLSITDGSNQTLSRCSDSTGKLDNNDDNDKMLTDPVEEFVNQVFRKKHRILKTFTYSCCASKHLWVHRGQARNGLSGRKDLKGLSLEREVTTKVLELLGLMESGASRKTLIKAVCAGSKTTGNNLTNESESTDVLSNDMKTDNLSAESSSTSQPVQYKKFKNKKTKVQKEREKVAPNKSAEKGFQLRFTCKVVDSYFVPSSSPRIVLLMHATQDQLGTFRGFFPSFNWVISHLVSSHLLDLGESALKSCVRTDL